MLAPKLSDQLSWRGILIGSIGCVIITASSAYTALKLGMLPWPIVFAALISLFFLQLFGKTSLNEVNVTHTIMSAGAMVAGGMAFTIPGAWMLGLAPQQNLLELILIALAGALLGLIAAAFIHASSMADKSLSFPMGTACAESLSATQAPQKMGLTLFSSLGGSALFALLRDHFALLPQLIAPTTFLGSNLALYNSPMMCAVGALIGRSAALFWATGAIASIVLKALCTHFFGEASAAGILSSLGMGLMMGAGIGVILKDIIFKQLKAQKEKTRKTEGSDLLSYLGSKRLILASLVIGVALLFGLKLNFFVVLLVIIFSFVSTIMAAQSCGQTGIDPMEIFALIVLLIVAAVSQTDTLRLFYIAAIIAVCCGLAGDVMNDFKAGQIIGTDPRAQWLGQAIGAVLGAVVSALVLYALVNAYGVDAFGPGKAFISTQASVVATLISGLPSAPSFIAGVALGTLLYCLGIPAILIGLGVYLPLYLSLTAILGAALKELYLKVTKKEAEAAEKTSLLAASGILGGESIMGVLLALFALAQNLIH